MRFLFLLPIVYGLWKIASVSVINRAHRDDPDDKIVFIPQRGQPTNPLVINAGGLRRIGRATRRRWIVLSVFSSAVVLGLVPVYPAAVASL